MPVDDGTACISLDVFVEPQPFLHLTVGQIVTVLLQELQDDRVPVHLIQVALSGQM